MNYSDINIRKASISDIDELVPLLYELFYIEEDFTFNRELQIQGLKILIDTGKDNLVLVAEEDNKIVGMCTLQTLISTAQGGYVGLIEDFVITESHRGKGIGRELLISLEKSAAEKGLKRIQLLADKNNLPAIKFYTKMNWTTTKLICLRRE